MNRELDTYWVVEYWERRDGFWRAMPSRPFETRREARAMRDHNKTVFAELKLRVSKFIRADTWFDRISKVV